MLYLEHTDTNNEYKQHLVFIQRLLVHPEVVEPLDDARLELLSHAAELHVALDTVHLLLERRPLGVHVRDHAADVTDDRREDQHADEEVHHDEHVLDVLLRPRRLADRCQRQRRPVERVDVHPQQGGVRRIQRLVDVEVDPLVAAETDPGGHLEVEAGVPVDDHEDVHHQVDDAERVRVVRARLRAVEELEHALGAREAVEADVRLVDADQHVEHVGGQHADDVVAERRLLRVVTTHLRRVRHHHALLQVGCATQRENVTTAVVVL